MLNDIERKLLRIIANYSAGRNRYPSIQELEIKTGRDPKVIMVSLEVLTNEGYIQWSRQDRINFYLSRHGNRNNHPSGLVRDGGYMEFNKMGAKGALQKIVVLQKLLFCNLNHLSYHK